MSRTVSIDEMADAINEGLKEYATLASTEVKKAVRKSAKTVKDQISANAPSRTGAYKGSWVATKQSESSQSLQMVVHSKNRYQLAHLWQTVMSRPRPVPTPPMMSITSGTMRSTSRRRKLWIPKTPATPRSRRAE